ncbi:MAG: efflux RND transporter periplasmic adaptor subunit [Candidatus Pacebacteria bacterium]|nr:efflux RND transporter periplasmic adaptor subunit [Candidatus Paceibacterota bacterium]
MLKLFKKIIIWPKRHKILASLLFFLILLGVIYLPRKVRRLVQGAEAEYETVTPRTTDLIQVVDVSGEIKAKEQVSLRFQGSGKLAWVGVEKGDWVKRGQAIASLDKRSLQKTLEKELYDYLSERWDFEQNHDDYDTSGLPLQTAPLTDAARRVLEKAQYDLNKTVLDYEIAQISYELAFLYSPIEGIVTRIEAPVAGINITPATAEFVITNPGIMFFEALIDEADIGQIREGQETILNLDAYPDQEFVGTISKIDFTSVPTSGGGTAYPAEISLGDNSDRRFKVGMNGDGEIIIARREEAISIPLEAISEKNGSTRVLVIKDKKLEEVEIKTGLSTDTRIEVISGLSKDQKVVTGKKKTEKK